MKTLARPMMSWLHELDRILRGETTCQRELFRDSPKNADIRFPVGGISFVLGALGSCYGLCMGVFALVRGFETGSYGDAYLQLAASMCKLPLLFALTTVVTFPSLYVFNSLVGSSLKIGPLFRLLMASFVVNVSVLASLGPIIAFFSLSTPNYSFIVLLNVGAFTLSGLIGLGFMVQTLQKLQSPPPADIEHEIRLDKSNAIKETVQEIEVVQAVAVLPGVSTSESSFVSWGFRFWMVAFALVGAQMGWVLRPFIGTPGQHFEWFRTRHSNFFEAVWQSLQNVCF